MKKITKLDIVLVVTALIWMGLIAHIAMAKAPPAKGSITVEIVNLENADGAVYGILFDGPDGFPRKQDQAAGRAVGNIEGKVARLVFEDLPYGDYAIIVFHDENGNKKLDKSFVGKPKERLGFSNGATIEGGAPEFDEAKIILNEETKTVRIEL